jgi:hypothetical protein
VWVPEGEEPDWDELRARGLLPEPGFEILLPRRWVVERTFSWVEKSKNEQGLREAHRHGRGVNLGGDEPPDDEAVGPLMRLFIPNPAEEFLKHHAAWGHQW